MDLNTYQTGNNHIEKINIKKLQNQKKSPFFNLQSNNSFAQGSQKMLKSLGIEYFEGWNICMIPKYCPHRLLYLMIIRGKNMLLQWKDTANTTLFIFLNLFIYFWLCWVFLAARGLSLVVVSGGYSSLRCTCFSLQWLLLLRSTGPRVQGLQQLWRAGSVVVVHGLQSAGSVAVAHRLSCSAVCGIFLDQGSNPCLLHWQANS